LKKRNLMIVKNRKEILIIINNITIIKIAEDFVKEKEEKLGMYDKINHIRLWKRINLPIELVSSNGQLEILYFKDDLAMGPIR